MLATIGGYAACALRRARFFPHGSALPREARMTIASNLGFPRIGRRRELKIALERLLGRRAGRGRTCSPRPRAARRRIGSCSRALGISHVPSGDFSLYDHVLDTACMLGAIPAGYGWQRRPGRRCPPISRWHAARAARRRSARPASRRACPRSR